MCSAVSYALPTHPSNTPTYPTHPLAPAPPPATGIPAAGIPKLCEAVIDKSVDGMKPSKNCIRLRSDLSLEDLEAASKLLATCEVPWADAFPLPYLTCAGPAEIGGLCGSGACVVQGMLLFSVNRRLKSGSPAYCAVRCTALGTAWLPPTLTPSKHHLPPLPACRATANTAAGKPTWGAAAAGGSADPAAAGGSADPAAAGGNGAAAQQTSGSLPQAEAATPAGSMPEAAGAADAEAAEEDKENCSPASRKRKADAP